MVDHFSGLTYVHLMRITIQDENVSGKTALKIRATIFVVKIHRYYADDGIFSEQPFISDNTILWGWITLLKCHS